MDLLAHDLRHTLRGLARSPGFTAAAVAMLALGIGANCTMFAVVNTLLLEPPAYVQDAGRVERVYFRVRLANRIGIRSGTSFPVYESLRATPGIVAVAAFTGGSVSIGYGAGARPAHVRPVTASYFPLLGVRLERGRFFDSMEDQLGAGPVAIVSHTFWTRQMATDPAVLGRTLRIGQFAYSIVGVAPKGFTGADLEEPDLWLPIQQSAPLLAGAAALSTRRVSWVGILVRLAPEATVPSATVNANVAFRRAAIESGSPEDTLASLLLAPIQAARGPEMSSDAKVALCVGAVALIVLLVACANLANLLLVRGLGRETEIAVRAALGATRGRLVRHLLTESLVLALAGGIAGLLLALWGGSVVRAYLLPRIPPSASLLDLRVLVFTTGIACVSGLLAGSLPAWQSIRAGPSVPLRSGRRDVSRTRGFLRSALLLIQVALTTVLLVGAGLFIRSLRHAERLDYGLDLEHVLVAQADAPFVGSAGAGIARADLHGIPVDPQSALYLRLRERIKRDPAVASADVSVGTPYQSGYVLPLRALGQVPARSPDGGGPYFMAVSPGYFSTVGTQIVRGRSFTDTDINGAPPVVVVGQTLAGILWPHGDPIGQCVFILPANSTCVRVVGVVSDSRPQVVTQEQSLTYYVPFAQIPIPAPIDGLLIRTRGSAHAFQAEVQRVLQSAEPGLPFVRVESLLDMVQPQWRSWQLGAAMLTVFGVLALAIASLGLYAVTSYTVTQRTREIGVRMALGAQHGDVVKLAVTPALRATALGIAVGLGISAALSRGVASLLFGVQPIDPLSGFAALILLLAVATAAAWIPARRAARTDPIRALRCE
jgi:predicted permease